MRTTSFRILTTSLALAGILFGLLQTGSLAYAKEPHVHQTANTILLAQTTVGETTINTFGLDASKDASGVKLTDNTPYEIVGILINVVLSFLGVIFFVMIIYAGILWMTSRGNSEQVKKAKGILQNAIIGFIIVAMAYVITQNIYDIITSKLPGQTEEQKQSS